MLKTSQITGHVHIDRLKIVLPFIHPKIGDDKWEFTSGDTGEIRQAANSQSGSLDYHESTYYLHSKHVQPCGTAMELEVDVCPPKLLGRHNCFGHGNLVRYVNQVMDKLLSEAKHLQGIKPSEEDKARWLRGDFRVLGVHLTANFRCPRERVHPIIRTLDAHNDEGKQKNYSTSISLGYTGKKRSQLRTLTVYDKWVERSEEWRTPGPTRKKILDAISDSIRAEVKLYSARLKQLNLDVGSRWQAQDADALYFEELKKFKVWVNYQPHLTIDEMRGLKDTQRNALIAWQHGTPYQKLFDVRQTGAKHTKAILDLTGIDIQSAKRPKPLDQISTMELFTPQNIIPVPEWLKNSDYFVGE